MQAKRKMAKALPVPHSRCLHLLPAAAASHWKLRPTRSKAQHHSSCPISLPRLKETAAVADPPRLSGPNNAYRNFPAVDRGRVDPMETMASRPASDQAIAARATSSRPEDPEVLQSRRGPCLYETGGR